jgi:lysophospholipase L1-like esterase
VVAQNPGIVIIDCGINDMVGGQSRSEIMANIDAMVNIAEANGIEPILAELTPFDSPCPSPCETILGPVHTEVLAQMDDPLVALNQADGGGLVPYALKHHLRIAWIWRALSLADGYVIPGSAEYPSLSPDGVHPTLSGQWPMYSSMQDALNPPVN